MDWDAVNPSIETIRKRHQQRIEMGGPAELALCDQDLMFFKNILEKLDFNRDTVTDEALYYIMVGTITTWWVAIRSKDADAMTDDEYAAAVAAASTAAWGILSLARPHWLVVGSELPT